MNPAVLPVVKVEPKVTAPSALIAPTEEIVTPVEPYPPPTVNTSNTAVPVSVGLADMTTLPVPVMALETRALEPSVNTACEAVSAESTGAAVSVKIPVTESA